MNLEHNHDINEVCHSLSIYMMHWLACTLQKLSNLCNCLEKMLSVDEREEIDKLLALKANKKMVKYQMTNITGK